MGPRLMRTGFLVCNRGCLDVPQQQLRPRIIPPDPVPIYQPRPEFYALDNGLQGFSQYLIDPPTVAAAPVYGKSFVLSSVAAISGVPTPGNLTDYGGAITASQVSQALVPALAARTYLLLFNPTFVPLVVSFAIASFLADLSITLNTGQALLFSPTLGNGLQSAGAMTIAGFKPGQPYYAWQSADFWNDGGWLVLLDTAGWPTSPAGLPAGAVWNNGGLVSIVPGVTPNPHAPALFFGLVTAAQLLATGGGNLPLANPGLGSGQLWNDGGVASIA